MHKSKDIYEHIAKVYLDPTLKRNQQKAPSKSVFNNLFRFNIILIACLIVFIMLIIFVRKQPPKSRVALILETATTKINYDFNQVKKEVAIFDLKDMDLSYSKILSFRARKTNYQDELHMSVEFINKFDENSRIYIKQIPTQWRDFSIDLAEFKEISNWSGMQQLLFVLEEWNAQAKKGIVYIDDIYFLRD